MTARLAVAFLLCSVAAATDDTSLIQVAPAVVAALEIGDMGMEMGSDGQPPIPFAEVPASDYNIPSLGGDKTLTKAATSFKFWKVADGQQRTFKSVDSDGYFLYGTKAIKETKRGRTVLYDATTKAKMAVIWMDTTDSAIRSVPLKSTLAKPVAMLRENLGYAYHVNTYKPHCSNQGSVGEDQVTGAPLYAFATVTKVTGHNRFHVERVKCDAEGSAEYKLAYTLDKHGMKTAFDAVAPDVGVVGTMDTVLSQDWVADISGKTFRKRYDAWLAKGEDPALFALSLMITQMPDDPSPPPQSLLQTSNCADVDNMPDCEEAGCTWNTDNEDPGNEHCA